MKCITIDSHSRRAGTCAICRASTTVYASKLLNGSWSWACVDCSKGAEAML